MTEPREGTTTIAGTTWGWLGQTLPGLERLLRYRRDWLRGHLLAVITVAAYQIPRCMAYAELAGVAPVGGPWAILPPLLLCSLLGSSPQLSVGPESTTAVMTAAGVGPLAGGDAASYATLASALALLVGRVLTGNGITRTGNGAYSLFGGDALSDGEREALLELCRHQRSASATSSNWSARAGMLSETICQMVSSSRPK